MRAVVFRLKGRKEEEWVEWRDYGSEAKWVTQYNDLVATTPGGCCAASSDDDDDEVPLSERRARVSSKPRGP